MTDVFTKKKRSEVMSKIRSKNTKLEASFCKLVSAELYPLGFRYRRNSKSVLGRPDMVFLKQKLAIFLDGDFLHGYTFKKIKNRLPKKYWHGKIMGNIERDKKITKTLKKNGWKVLRIWEHEIKKNPQKCVEKIAKYLKI